MHIVFVDTTLTTPPTGGAHTFLVDIAKCLDAGGHRVAVVTQPGPDESLVKALRIAGVEVCMDLWANTHLPEQRGERLAHWVNDRNPDVYVVSASADVGWLALPHLSIDIATISIAHNDDSSFYEPLAHYHPFVDTAVAVSSEILRKIVGANVAKERAKQIPYGIASISKAELEERFSSHDGTTLQIAYVGRIVQGQKRIMELVPLMRKLKARQIRFQLNLVGDGSHRVQLSEAFAADGLSEFVHFWGWQSSAGVKELLHRMDVFVLLSDYEGLPVALLEAMAHGLAPVVSRIASGNIDVINHSENGYLVNVGDIEGFAARLELLAKDRSLLRTIQRAAWLTSQDYTLQIMVERYLKCFANALELGLSKEFRREAGGDYPIMRSCHSRYPAWLRKIKYHIADLASDGAFTKPR
jgi:glycosyltransferase involved in cell wall biosynthesis